MSDLKIVVRSAFGVVKNFNESRCLLAEFTERLAQGQPLHSFYPSLSPDSSASNLALGFPRFQIRKEMKPNQSVR